MLGFGITMTIIKNLYCNGKYVRRGRYYKKYKWEVLKFLSKGVRMLDDLKCYEIE